MAVNSSDAERCDAETGPPNLSARVRKQLSFSLLRRLPRLRHWLRVRAAGMFLG